jgi:hypothetical protein
MDLPGGQWRDAGAGEHGLQGLAGAFAELCSWQGTTDAPPSNKDPCCTCLAAACQSHMMCLYHSPTRFDVLVDSTSGAVLQIA